MTKGTHKPWENYDILNKLYTVEEKSTQQIAAIYDTFPNTIRRALKRLGITRRDKGDAQKNYLKHNGHQMTGRKRSRAERVKISQGVQDYFEGMSEREIEEYREKLSERASAKWEAMSEKEKTASIHKMHVASRLKAGSGSKNENLVAQLLAELGYSVVQRSKKFSPNQQYEIDIAIPDKSLAIEWDGAAHYIPIYGEEALERAIAKDKAKNAALTSFNWAVLRCRDHSTAHSLAFCQRAVAQIIEGMEKVRPGSILHLDMF